MLYSCCSTPVGPSMPLRPPAGSVLRAPGAVGTDTGHITVPRRRAGMTHLTYLEAAVVGLVQGVSEMFPISSLGHSVLIPAIVGGSWASDLNVAKPESPYLAFIVGLHVATAIALLIYFWRDWVRIIGGFFSSIGHWQGWHPRVATRDEKLAWMIILATIPVGL